MRQIEIKGRTYPISPREPSQEVQDAVTAVRALNTSKRRRIEASILVLDYMLGSGVADEVFGRYQDEEIALGDLLHAADTLAQDR
ncbi:hypothetical protein [Actinomadura sp. 6N118]|uniref:hypothetical protein n=1 Tax=Actinomadura sp. 6N118 TaxID=3375151 RepID=UPI0037946F65